MSAQGAHAVIGARNAARGADALRALPGRGSVLALELASLQTVRQAASDLHERFERLDILINNAGLWWQLGAGRRGRCGRRNGCRGVASAPPDRFLPGSPSTWSPLRPEPESGDCGRASDLWRSSNSSCWASMGILTCVRTRSS
ncbi:SDR family NAD(P)-dependent oxidoreductase [Micromonospora sp. CA-240977]|uniref:SDR family NAD(P)-dependent oxidoreductase n=1 Tax=Micromonospora sp. CA-240977 TaxID=3239957 RepID=UPI003D8F9621